MNDVPGIRCLVACDTPQGVRVCALELPAGATVTEALRAAREQLPGATVDWERARCGIWGRVCARSTTLHEGDRVELYRELPQDPRQRRREQVRQGRRR